MSAVDEFIAAKRAIALQIAEASSRHRVDREARRQQLLTELGPLREECAKTAHLFGDALHGGFDDTSPRCVVCGAPRIDESTEGFVLPRAL